MLRTITKIGPLLDLFSVERPEWGVTETAEALGIPRSSAHGLLTSLAETGLLRSTPRGRYRLGWRFVEVYEILHAGTDLRSIAGPVIRSLNEQTGETTNLAVLERGEVLYLDKVASRHQVSVAGLRVGSRLQPHGSSLGKALLAFANPAVVDAVLAAPLRRFTPHTITDPEVLRAQLETVRRCGVATENGEVAPDVACLAVPVKDSFGAVAGAISLSGPSFRIDAKRAELTAAIKAAGAEISRRLAEAEPRPT